MALPASKRELVKFIEDERKRWDDLLGQVGESRMQVAGVVGEWSVKNIVSHLTAWENQPVAWLRAIRSGQEPAAPPWDPGLDETETNAWIYEHSRDRLLSDVLEESRRTHRDLVELLQGADQKDLLSGSRYTWLEGSSLLESIAGNTFDHYREHGDQVRSWLARL